MLKLVEITKEYKVDEESVLALHNLSIEFRQNEFVSILGPSGCGKTTLLNIIGGLDRYTSGDIQIDGISTEEYDDVDWDTYRNKRIGFVFQSYNLIPHMNVLKNVSLSLTLAGIPKEEAKARALEALRKVGLEKQAKKKPNQMSGGQMQRVAIARALVNNPDIILADEPTGALDSESGLQVMELLKDVAKDRLVIMVTHNGQLAEEYSTRIVNLKDGEIVGDTMPYDSREGLGCDRCGQDADECVCNQDGIFVLPPKKKFSEKLKEKIRKAKAKEKSSMSVATAVNLSWNNLLSKKGRTLLTSIAGSIGIIGIILVLALSNGVNKYIHTLEENALSQYPITIEKSGVSLSAVMDLMTNQNPNNNTEYPDDGVIHVSKMLGLIMEDMDILFSQNDLQSLKKYIDKNFDTSLGVVKYDYGTTFNVYAKDPKSDTDYMKINPYTDSMDKIFEGLEDNSVIQDAIGELLGTIENLAVSFSSTWDEISDNQSLLDQQYDVVSGSWPTAPNEVVIVVDSRNQLPDMALFALGLRSPSDITGVIIGGSDNAYYADFTVQDLLNLEYVLMSNGDYFYNSDSGISSYNKAVTDKAVIDSLVENGSALKLKVSGVIRPKAGATVTSINGYVGYTKALSQMMLHRAETNVAAAAQLKAFNAAQTVAEGEKVTEENFQPYNCAIGISNYYKDVPNSSSTDDGTHKEAVTDVFTIPKEGLTYVDKEGRTQTIYEIENGLLIRDYNLHVELMRLLGVADEDDPQSIKIYCSSFESKREVEAFLEQYSAKTGNNIKYTDMLAIMMSFVEQMSTTMSNVLVGFAAISLIVSTIMIAIIIYTSVLERRKEIGVLRSLGARKKDISRVFIAESAMLGAYSGVLGLILSLIFAAIGNVILAAVLQIKGLMTVSWWHCVVMFFVSIALSIFAGFIPSRIAAKKDPTVALRSE